MYYPYEFPAELKTELDSIYALITKSLNPQGTYENILTKWWPGHKVKYITSYQDYVDIADWLDRVPGPKIIAQVEEDWFLKTDYRTVRQTIVNHTNWSNESFVISNSRWDCDCMTAMGIRALCRPGIGDLLAYQEPVNHTWQSDLIVDHLSLVYGHLDKYLDQSRLCLIDTVLQWPDRVGFILGGGKPILVNRPELLERCFIDTPDHKTAPWMPASADFYLATSAFSAVVETQYRGIWCPTLSEKTYHCYHWQCPVIVNGGYRTRDYLKNLGFDTCDWLFDWHFDSYECPDQRQNGFLAEVERLLHMPLENIKSLIEANRSSLVHNQLNIRRLICRYSQLDDVLA